jgi:hypothetical protein
MTNEYRARLYAERSHYAKLAYRLSTGLLMNWDTLTPDDRTQCQRDLHAASVARDALTQQIDWEQFKIDRANGIEYIGTPSPAWNN